MLPLLQGSALHLVTTVSLGVGTFVVPKIPLRTAIQRPTMTSSETFSMMAAASPATRASKTGALYRFQKRKSSPLLAVVEPTCPNRLLLLSQKILSKQRTTLLRFPYPSL